MAYLNESGLARLWSHIVARLNNKADKTDIPDVSKFITETELSAHNTSTSAHNDIRDLVAGLNTRLNALADSDDTTLDQMSEIVAYIKSNKTLIENVTTNKVNVSDIIDNLTTNIANKPLSAAQGVALKALIDAIEVPELITIEDVNDVCGIGIYQHPEDAYVAIGGQATFSTKAIGEGLTYQWRYSTNNGDGWIDSGKTGNKTDTLSLGVESYHNNYLFKCVVTDDNNNKENTRSAKLRVWGITNQPQSQAIVAGDTGTFSVEAIGVASYQWQILGNSGYWNDLTWNGATTATMTHVMNESNIQRQYRCKLTGKDGSVIYTDVMYFVQASIVKQPEDAIVLVGDTAAFTFEVEGEGLTYQWEYSTDNGVSFMNNTQSGNQTDTLTFKAQDYHNGYLYRCKITDASGNTVTSDTVILTIVPILITKQPENVTAAVGETATFSVEANGDGLTYQWQWLGDGNTGWRNTSLTGSQTNTITAEATEARNGYQYRCVVTDVNGNTVASDAATLTVTTA